MMKVVILAGGLGTRLREETEFRPKPMVYIGTKPIIWHIMKIYSKYGYNDFIICLGYKGEMIKEYFYHYELMNSDFSIELGNRDGFKIHDTSHENGWKITLAHTGEHTLKGARLKKIEKYIDDDLFFTTYGDGVADVNINALLAFHRQHGKIATITGVNSASRFGELHIDGNKIIRFREKPERAPGFVNGGFFVFDRRIFPYLSEDENCDLECGTFEQLASNGELMIYKHPGIWSCMDTLRDMDYLNGLWNSGKAFWKIW
jgi:glucose-1-phosphate cytidylyltransferase